MKKFLILLLSLTFALSLSIPALADDAMDLECTYSVTNDGKIVVKASVVNITDSTGIAVFEYAIKYDTAALTLNDAKVNMPDSWKPLVDSEMAEDWSRPVEGGYVWSIMNIVPGNGVKENGQIFIELTFTPKGTASTNIEFIKVGLGNDELVEIEGPNKTLTVSSDSNNSDAPVSSEAVESSTTTESGNAVESSEIVESSVTNESNETNESGNAVESNEIVESDVTSESDNGNNKVLGLDLIWVILIAAVLVIGGTVCVLVFKSKGKK